MKLKRPAAIACTLALALASVSAVAATQGSQEDPLLTLSYLDKVLKPQLEDKVDAAVEANRAELAKQMDIAVTSYENRVDEALAAAGVGAFQSKELSAGDSFTPGAGRELLLVSGAASALGKLTDTTAGKTLSAGDRLEANHLYVTSGDNAGCRATAASVVMSR